MSVKIRAVIVDDEPLARDALRVMLKGDREIEIVAECGDGREAVAAVREFAPDIIFLDVQMPDLDGFAVVERIGIENMPVTIFVTAFDRYALRAFAAHALDYLLKPFDHERFDDAIARAKQSVRQRKFGEASDNLFALIKEIKDSSQKSPSETAGEESGASGNKELPERLAIKASGSIYFLKTETIDWIEATGDYARLYADGKAHLMRETMTRLHARLDPKKFLRIHRSIIVNIESIKDVQPLFNGAYIVTLTSGKRLKSSRGYRSELQSLLDEAR